MRFITTGLVSVLLSGCIFPPIMDYSRDSNPFRTKALDWIEIGATTRDDVRTERTVPYTEFGPWWIYSADRNMGQWHAAVNAFDIQEMPLGEARYRSYYLAIMFDKNDLVQAVEVFHQDWNGCRPSGLCYEDGNVQFDADVLELR